MARVIPFHPTFFCFVNIIWVHGETVPFRKVQKYINFALV